MPQPSLVPLLEDDFNRADNANVGNSSVSGLAWSDAISSGGSGCKIASNAIIGEDANTAGECWLNYTPAGAFRMGGDVIDAGGGSGDLVELVFRTASENTASYTAYFARFFRDGTWGLIQVKAGAFTDITSSCTTSTADFGTLATGDQIMVECYDQGGSPVITAYVNSGGSWQALYSIHDTSANKITADGHVGVGFIGTPNKFSLTNFYVEPITVSATRFYLETSTDAPDISPSATLIYSWNKTTGFGRIRLIPTGRKLGTTLTNQSNTTTNVTANDVLFRQCVGDRMRQQLVRGHFAGIIRVVEAAASSNIAAQCLVGVISSDGTTLRKLMNSGQTKGSTSGASPPEWQTSLTNRKFPQSWASPGTLLIPYICAEGDRIQIDVGFGQASTTNNVAQNFNLGSSASSDCAEDETSTAANNPWFEFRSGLFFPSMLPNLKKHRRNVLLRM